MDPYLAVMSPTYLSSDPKNKDYLQRETLDPLALLEHLEHPACVAEFLCSASIIPAKPLHNSDTDSVHFWRPRRRGVLLVFAEFCLVWEGFVCSRARDLYVSYLSAMKSSIFATVVAVTSMYRRQFRF